MQPRISTKQKISPTKDEIYQCWHLLIFPGSCPPSIFSASELNFCVRYGNRWTLTAINTDLNCRAFRHLYIKQYALFNANYDKIW